MYVTALLLPGVAVTGPPSTVKLIDPAFVEGPVESLPLLQATSPAATRTSREERTAEAMRFRVTCTFSRLQFGHVRRPRFPTVGLRVAGASMLGNSFRGKCDRPECDRPSEIDSSWPATP